MKLTKDYQVVDAATGEYAKQFGGPFATPQDAVLSVADAERRMVIAMASQELPDPADKKLIDSVKGKSFTIQEVITFN